MKDDIAIEQATTPINIKIMQKPCSHELPPPPVISPYPTVVIVVTIKYNAATYCSIFPEPVYPQRSTQPSSASYPTRNHKQPKLWHKTANTIPQVRIRSTSTLLRSKSLPRALSPALPLTLDIFIDRMNLGNLSLLCSLNNLINSRHSG